MKPRAFCYIRDLPHYRREAFVHGAERAGFEVVLHGGSGGPRAGDVVLIWNRYGHYDSLATAAEKAGAIVLVSENGFAGRDAHGNQFYQLAVGGHNGSGWWHVGNEDRLAKQGLVIQPWQSTAPDAPVIVRGQRGIGKAGVASPPDWHNSAAATLRQWTKRRIVVVPHPGNGAVDDTAHERYLRGAHALAVWASSVGVKALLAGVPVLCDAPRWICRGASSALSHVESDWLRSSEADGHRRRALHSMAWAQWSLEEIASGEPITLLLSKYEQHLQREEAVA